MNHSEAGKLGKIKTKEIHEENYRKRIKSYDDDPNFCSFCGKPLSYEKRKNKFCNHSCSATFINSNQLGGNFKDGNYVIESHPCAFCGKTIDKRKIRKYCSLSCHAKYKWEERKKEVSLLTDLSKYKSTAKKHITEIRGHKCEICGLSEWLGDKLPLVLDHINGNSDDWMIINLRLICSNCDSLTPTYKNKNIGNGRHSRMKRYKEGKSY